jgi:outer membrane protein assembly factor BamD
VPAQEEALFILVRSYDALGMTQLRDDAMRVMEKTYPKSEYLTKGVKSSHDPWWKMW